MTFAKGPGTKKPKEDLKVRAAVMVQNALKAVVNLVEVSQLVDLPEVMKHCVIKECVPLFNSSGTYRKTRKSKLNTNSLCNL